MMRTNEFGPKIPRNAVIVKNRYTKFNTQRCCTAITNNERGSDLYKSIIGYANDSLHAEDGIGLVAHIIHKKMDGAVATEEAYSLLKRSGYPCEMLRLNDSNIFNYINNAYIIRMARKNNLIGLRTFQETVSDYLVSIILLLFSAIPGLYSVYSDVFVWIPIPFSKLPFYLVCGAFLLLSIFKAWKKRKMIRSKNIATFLESIHALQRDFLLKFFEQIPPNKYKFHRKKKIYICDEFEDIDDIVYWALSSYLKQAEEQQGWFVFSQFTERVTCDYDHFASIVMYINPLSTDEKMRYASKYNPERNNHHLWKYGADYIMLNGLFPLKTRKLNQNKINEFVQSRASKYPKTNIASIVYLIAMIEVKFDVRLSQSEWTSMIVVPLENANERDLQYYINELTELVFGYMPSKTALLIRDIVETFEDNWMSIAKEADDILSDDSDRSFSHNAFYQLLLLKIIWLYDNRKGHHLYIACFDCYKMISFEETDHEVNWFHVIITKELLRVFDHAKWFHFHDEILRIVLHHCEIWRSLDIVKYIREQDIFLHAFEVNTIVGLSPNGWELHNRYIAYTEDNSDFKYSACKSNIVAYYSQLCEIDNCKANIDKGLLPRIFTNLFLVWSLTIFQPNLYMDRSLFLFPHEYNFFMALLIRSEILSTSIQNNTIFALFTRNIIRMIRAVFKSVNARCLNECLDLLDTLLVHIQENSETSEEEKRLLSLDFSLLLIFNELIDIPILSFLAALVDGYIWHYKYIDTLHVNIVDNTMIFSILSCFLNGNNHHGHDLTRKFYNASMNAAFPEKLKISSSLFLNMNGATRYFQEELNDSLFQSPEILREALSDCMNYKWFTEDIYQSYICFIEGCLPLLSEKVIKDEKFFAIATDICEKLILLCSNDDIKSSIIIYKEICLDNNTQNYSNFRALANKLTNYNPEFAGSILMNYYFAGKSEKVAVMQNYESINCIVMNSSNLDVVTLLVAHLEYIWEENKPKDYINELLDRLKVYIRFEDGVRAISVCEGAMRVLVRYLKDKDDDFVELFAILCKMRTNILMERCGVIVPLVTSNGMSWLSLLKFSCCIFEFVFEYCRDHKNGFESRSILLNNNEIYEINVALVHPLSIDENGLSVLNKNYYMQVMKIFSDKTTQDLIFRNYGNKQLVRIYIDNSISLIQYALDSLIDHSDCACSSVLEKAIDILEQYAASYC